ncbi:MAG: GNAT family N-acetyltransferase [Bacteroidota bacterium]|nr:GNAT family N-acetyltransferase [Bacteroidota bacterium]
MITWSCKSFDELTNEELYKILQLRIEVFAVEQNVVYQDCDNKDFKSHHLTRSIGDKITAYSRIIPPGLSYPGAASIGRVVTASQVRNQSFGKQLLKKSIEEVYNLFGSTPIIISAQLYLKRFYESFSFIQKGEGYLEDSIPHIAMVKNI